MTYEHVTVEQWLRLELFVSGMIVDEINAAVDRLKRDHDAMRNRWGDSIEGYPAEFTTALLLDAKGSCDSA
jgi:hypothetical protein